jgi:hypothetical protein
MTFPTCVTDHSLNNDVHEEAVVVCWVDLLHHVLSHLNSFMDIQEKISQIKK